MDTLINELLQIQAIFLQLFREMLELDDSFVQTKSCSKEKEEGPSDLG